MVGAADDGVCEEAYPGVAEWDHRQSRCWRCETVRWVPHCSLPSLYPPLLVYLLSSPCFGYATPLAELVACTYVFFLLFSSVVYFYRVTAMADKLGIEFAIIHRKRDGKSLSSPEHMEILVGDVKDKVRVILLGSFPLSCALYLLSHRLFFREIFSMTGGYPPRRHDRHWEHASASCEDSP